MYCSRRYADALLASAGAGRPTLSLEYPKEYTQRTMATKLDVVSRAEHVMVGRVYKKSEARQ